MKFIVTDSPNANDDYEVTGLGLVESSDGLCKPGIGHIIRWLCEEGGNLWIGNSRWELCKANEKTILSALGYGKDFWDNL